MAVVSAPSKKRAAARARNMKSNLNPMIRCKRAEIPAAKKNIKGGGGDPKGDPTSAGSVNRNGGVVRRRGVARDIYDGHEWVLARRSMPPRDGT